MIHIQIGGNCETKIVFVYKDFDNEIPQIMNGVFDASFLSSFPLLQENKLVLYIGLGSQNKFSVRKMLDAVAKGVKQLEIYNHQEAEVDLSAFIKIFGVECIRNVVLGVELGLYKFSQYRTENKDNLFNFFLKGIEQTQITLAQECLRKAENLAAGVVSTRNLVNTPSNLLTPDKMAKVMKIEAEQCGVQVEILDELQIAALGMGAFLSVGNSSGNPPRLIVLRYFAAPESPVRTALVGKGVTCDTGGYCLKSKDSMLGIKGDMAGGASVANAIFALAKNGVKTNVVGVIPACENRISRQSFTPGDVIQSMSGKTIEIQNTDAEGRLILADAVTYAIRVEGATRVLDIATLTGAVVGTFGFTTAGVLTNSDLLWHELESAADMSGEQYWRLPIFPEYEEMILSKIADIKNMGEHYCGTISAGLFVKAFSENLPWIHLDIAGTAWVDKPIFEHHAVGATGASVITLYDFLSTKVE